MRKSSLDILGRRVARTRSDVGRVRLDMALEAGGEAGGVGRRVRSMKCHFAEKAPFMLFPVFVFVF